MSNIPRVFISYSHDSPEHKEWVLNLATRLRNSGVDAIIDMWELQPGDDLPHFMETNIAAAKYVVMICTTRYVEKANEGKGGVGYEKMILTSEYLSKIDERKIIPVVRQMGTRNLPTFMKSKLYVDFSVDESYEYAFDDLVRTIHDSPLFIKPEVGNNPFQPRNELKELKQVDGIKEMIRAIASYYDYQHDYGTNSLYASHAKMSLVLFEAYLTEASGRGLVEKSRYSGKWQLTAKGKLYAVENDLIKKP